jgi:hypothetical protein
MRAEVVSDFYVPEEQQLSRKQYEMLLGLGWHAPTNLRDELEAGGRRSNGSPNYFLDLAQPVPFSIVADIGVKTLRDVYKAGHPGYLQYSAFYRGGDSIRLPNLGIQRRPK